MRTVTRRQLKAEYRLEVEKRKDLNQKLLSAMEAEDFKGCERFEDEIEKCDVRIYEIVCEFDSLTGPQNDGESFAPLN